MRWIVIWFILIMQSINAHGTGGDILPGGRVSAMGSAAVATSGIWSVATNQAGIAWLKGWSAGLYAENRFLVKELCYETIALTWSGKPGAFGMVVSYSGFSLYNEITAGITYARKFGRRFSAGVQLYYNRIQLGGEYGSKGLISCKIGLMYKPDDSWTLGIQVCNPVPVKVTDYPEERLPLLFKLGIGYDISGKVLVLLEGEKDLEHKPVIRSGVEIKLANKFWGRLGVISDPFMVTGGIGFEVGKIQVDFATRYHLVLGFSPSLSVVYSFHKK